ncbi:RNA recognition motif domain-containing protein [Candidatus Nitrospira bockiana]
MLAKVYITGLRQGTTEQELAGLLKRVGRPRRLRIESSKIGPIGVAEYFTLEEADRAIMALKAEMRGKLQACLWDSVEGRDLERQAFTSQKT